MELFQFQSHEYYFPFIVRCALRAHQPLSPSLSRSPAQSPSAAGINFRPGEFGENNKHETFQFPWGREQPYSHARPSPLPPPPQARTAMARASAARQRTTGGSSVRWARCPSETVGGLERRHLRLAAALSPERPSTPQQNWLHVKLAATITARQWLE